MRTLALIALQCATLTALLGSVAARKSPPPTTYTLAIFGDSVSDTGNTLRAAGVPDPSIYYKGRFTNGPNWVDYLNATLAKKNKVQIRNYAWGGASACPSNVSTVVFPFIKDLGEQVDDLVADVKAGLLPKGSNAKLLPIIYIGSNDVQFTLAAAARGVLPTTAQIVALLQGVVSCRLAAAAALAARLGVSDVVLLPMTPLQVAPAVPAFLKPQVQQLVDAIDENTAAAVAQLQAALDAGAPGKGTRIRLLGDSKWVERGFQLVSPPFRTLTESCFDVGSTLILHPGAVICADPDERAFYDNLHVSTRFHQWFAIQGVLPRLQQLRLLPTKV